MVFVILRILVGICQLVMMSGQKLQVKCRSKCTQKLSPGSAPRKPAIQALPYRECLCTWEWPRLGCASLRVRIWVSQRIGMSWCTSTQSNGTFLSYTWLEMHWGLLGASASCPKEWCRISKKCWGLRSSLSIAILGAFGQALSREGRLLPRLTGSFSKYILKCVNSWYKRT